MFLSLTGISFYIKKYPNTLGYVLCFSCQKKREDKIKKELAKSIADDLDFYDFFDYNLHHLFYKLYILND